MKNTSFWNIASIVLGLLVGLFPSAFSLVGDSITNILFASNYYTVLSSMYDSTRVVAAYGFIMLSCWFFGIYFYSKMGKEIEESINELKEIEDGPFGAASRTEIEAKKRKLKWLRHALTSLKWAINTLLVLQIINLSVNLSLSYKREVFNKKIIVAKSLTEHSVILKLEADWALMNSKVDYLKVNSVLDSLLLLHPTLAPE